MQSHASQKNGMSSNIQNWLPTSVSTGIMTRQANLSDPRPSLRAQLPCGRATAHGPTYALSLTTELNGDLHAVRFLRVDGHFPVQPRRHGASR